MNEAFGLAIRLGRVGFRADVFDLKPLASSAERKRPVAGSIVGHHALHFDAEFFVVGNHFLEKCNRAALLLAGHDLREGDARVIVDGDVNVLPTDASAVALSRAVPGNAMTDPIETAELFDVEVDHLTRMIAFIAPHWLDRLQCREPVEAQPSQDATDRGRRNTQFVRNLLAGVALPPQSFHGCACGRQSLAWR